MQHDDNHDPVPHRLFTPFSLALLYYHLSILPPSLAPPHPTTCIKSPHIPFTSPPSPFHPFTLALEVAHLMPPVPPGRDPGSIPVEKLSPRVWRWVSVCEKYFGEAVCRVIQNEGEEC